MTLTAQPLTMRFKRMFRISRGSRDEARNVLAQVEHEGVTGVGEGAPNPYYHGQTQQSALDAIGAAASVLGEDPFALDAIASALARALPQHPAARAAVDVALHDWVGRRLGVPVASLLGLPTGLRIATSYTISLGDSDEVREAAAAVPHQPILKLKLGGPDDLDLVRALRGATDATIRVDANAAWSVDDAIRNCQALEELGVELVEQPISPGNPEGLRTISRSTRLPIVADEDLATSADLARLVGAVAGVNIKLAKTGGLREAFLAATTARALGLDVMLGTMAESSIGTAAMAQLIPLARWVDLDGPLLLDPRDDPGRGLVYERGEILMPAGPGIGVSRA